MPPRVRVVRGRGETVAADRAVIRDLVAAAADGARGVRVWAPRRQLAFGRRDASRPGYERAREAARERGFTPIERRVGGRAVAYDGERTLAFARTEPVDDLRRGIEDRFDRLTGDVATALRSLDVSVTRGEPPDSFCPGTHSLQAPRTIDSREPPKPVTADGTGTRVPGRKLAGIAQRITNDAALVAGILVVDGADTLATVLDPVYDALDVPFDPASVGSVAGAGGPAEPQAVARAIEDALVGDATATYERVDG